MSLRIAYRRVVGLIASDLFEGVGDPGVKHLLHPHESWGAVPGRCPLFSAAASWYEGERTILSAVGGARGAFLRCSSIPYTLIPYVMLVSESEFFIDKLLVPKAGEPCPADVPCFPPPPPGSESTHFRLPYP